MFGNAMLTTVASMNAIAQPSDAIASTVRCEGPRLRTKAFRPLRVGVERLTNGTPPQLAHAGEHLPLHQSDLVNGGGDREVGVRLRRDRAVDAAVRHSPDNRLPDAGNLGLAAGQRAPHRG